MASTAVNTAFQVGNGFSQSSENASDLLVQAYRRTRQPAVDAITSKTKTLEDRRVFFNSLRSRLESVLSTSDGFVSSDAVKKFSTRKTVISDESVVNITANSNATTGVSSIKVNRLATNDTLISSQVTLSAANGNPSGTSTFSLNGRSYDVSLLGSETHEEVLNKIVQVVNADKDSKVSASLVKDTATTGRLTFTSASTGANDRVTFSDSNGLLARFGLTSSLSQNSSTGPLGVTSLTLVPGANSQITRDIPFSLNGQSLLVSTTGLTSNQEVLDAIAQTINNTPSANARATVDIDSSTGNISLSIASQTGTTFSLNDTDNQLANIGINSTSLSSQRTLSSGTNAGYRTAKSSELDANVTINGIDITRGNNTFDDALAGLSITLRKSQASGEAAVTLKTEVDKDQAINLVKPLLDSYNSTVDFLRSESRKAGNDSSLRSLQSRFRGLNSSQFGVATDSLRTLADVGMRVGADGKLAITDTTRFNDALTTNADAVAAIFTGTNGFAGKLREIAQDLTGSDGLAQTRSSNLGTQIRRLNEQRKTLESRIDREVEQQKREYRKLQESFYNLQGQQSSYSSFR